MISLAAAGCALQATGGPAAASHADPVAAVTLSLNTQAYRRSAGVFGVRMSSVVNDGLIPKQGILHAGFDVRALPGRLMLESGLDLGIGSSMTEHFGGAGAYFGAAGAARLWLCGVDDADPAFNVVGGSVELVVAPRAGAWMPPEGSVSTRLVGEWAVELGFRLALKSELFSEAQGKVREAPVTSPQAPGGPP